MALAAASWRPGSASSVTTNWVWVGARGAGTSGGLTWGTAGRIMATFLSSDQVVDDDSGDYHDQDPQQGADGDGADTEQDQEQDEHEKKKHVSLRTRTVGRR